MYRKSFRSSFVKEHTGAMRKDVWERGEVWTHSRWRLEVCRRSRYDALSALTLFGKYRA